MSQAARMGAPAAGSGQRRGSRTRAVAAVAIVLIGAGTLLGFYVFNQWFGAVKSAPAAMRDFAADIVRPKISVRELVLSSLSDVTRESKFVVLQTTVNVDVTREESGSSWGVYWGTNVARIRAAGMVQFFVDLNGLGSADMAVDEGAKHVVIRVPRPKLDDDMVNIDPSKIETLDLAGGWMRFDKRATWDRATAELRPKILEQARKDVLLKKEADESGMERLTELFRPLAETLRKDGVAVEVTYRD